MWLGKYKMKSMFRLIALILIAFMSLSELAVKQAQAQKFVGRTRPGALTSRQSVIYNWASGVLFDFAVYYGENKASGQPAASNQWDQAITIYDIKLGYVFDAGLYFGAEYSGQNENSSGSTVNGGTPAAGLGYFFGNGWAVRGFYRWNETWGGYKSGSGYQIDLGYMASITSDFYLGILLSRRETNFQTNDFIVGFGGWRRTETYPMLSFGFLIN